MLMLPSVVVVVVSIAKPKSCPAAAERCNVDGGEEEEKLHDVDAPMFERKSITQKSSKNLKSLLI